MSWDGSRRSILRFFFLVIVLLALFVEFGLSGASASANIRQLEEAPGQVVYQSRQTLTDQMGRSWQAIAFKRIRTDGSSHFYLRLVGFPGTAAIDRSQPLSIRNSMGQTLSAADASSQIFTDTHSPEPNVGQYDLQPLLPRLRAELPWHLDLSTTDEQTLTLPVPPSLVQEWHTLADL
ncbi:DUF3122 domain-containing protein [Egbenema bharatensis]|uniref:DUF3122 domain-containing protein n=1 Tax=Egbenema bharatensis TaxID=3463334 RepID=UPI003A89603D